MKKIAVFLILLAAVVLYSSCENNGTATSPTIIGKNIEKGEKGKYLSNSMDRNVYFFALDERDMEISSRVFRDVYEVKYIFSTKILKYILNSPVSIIQEPELVGKIKEILFNALPTSEYMSIQNIGILYLENGILYCSWSCLKICSTKDDTSVCMAKCCIEKGTGLVPYKAW